MIFSRSLSPKANTYSAVKHMVSQMESQIQGENADEDKHRAWCDAELSKNVAVADDKEAKLQRLSTKLDNEKETVNEVEQDLQLLAQEAQHVEIEFAGGDRVHDRYSSDNSHMSTVTGGRASGEETEDRAALCTNEHACW